MSTYDKKNITKTFDKGVDQGLKPTTQGQPSYTNFKKEQNTSKSTVTGPKCYNCKLIGHIAHDCTRPKRPLQCSKCGARGHTAKYCQTVTSDVALIDTSTVNRTLYVKRVQINEKSEEVQGLVDTGSALCIIKRSIAQKYGLTIKPRTVNLNVYGNSSCVIGGGETKAWLKIDSMKEPVDLLVVDDHIQNYDILIGRTFINKENVSFIKTPNQLSFDYNMLLPNSEEPNETITGQQARIQRVGRAMKRFLVPLSKSDESDESVTSKKIRKSSTTISVNNRDIQNNIFDINQNVENGPNQPNITFPRRNIGGKQRAFNVLWYSKYEWLEYSKMRDSIFCFYCRHFTSDNSGYRDEVLIVNGYSDWKHIGNMLEKHNSSNIHKLSLEKYKSWISAKKTGSVATKLNTQLKEDILKNREIMKSLIRCVLYCGRQDIGLRGHRETNNYIDDNDDDNLKTHIDPFQNNGNFIELVKLLGLENDDFKTKLNTLPKNAKYTSKTIQNEILNVSCKVILKSIVKEIQNGSNFYSIIVDEAKDESNIEQMGICVRYISDNRINERFLGFLELKELHAKALADSIQLFLYSINLDIKNCIGQSYDGASVMSGTINGVQQYIREMSKNPCPYVHCYAHRLNLVLVDASKHVSAIHNTIGILEAIYLFQSCSSLRNSLFLESQEDSDKKLKIPQHCEIRWVSKYKGIHFFKIRFKSVIKALKECTLSKKSKEAAEARGLLNQFATFDNLLTIFCLDELLLCINSLSVYLQTKSTDLSKCITLIECTKDQIESMRTENKFHDFYEKVIKSVEEISGEISIPVTERRKENVSSKLTDYFVTSSIGQNQMDNISEHEIKMRSQYFEIIDNIVMEMNRR
ncbi:hypothetical protein QTP88_029470 [Uroleucon formosanum]